MARGLPKSLMSLVGKGKISMKEAWRRHKSGKVRSSRKSYKRRSRSKKRRSNPVARRRSRWSRAKRRAKKMTVPLAPTLGLAAGISPTLFGFQGSQGPIRGAIWHFQNGGPAAGLKEFVRVGSMTMTGYDPAGFEPFGKYLDKGLLPILVGCLVHFVASKLGVNRYLGRAGVPIVRI